MKRGFKMTELEVLPTGAAKKTAVSADEFKAKVMAAWREHFKRYESDPEYRARIDQEP